MLVDVPLQDFTPEQLEIAKEHDFDPYNLRPQREQEGVYIGHLNSESYFEDGRVLHMNSSAYRDRYRALDARRQDEEMSWDEYFALSSELRGWYGVADNYEQVLRHYAEQVADPDKKYVLLYTPIFREHQTPTGGWRWHKWGEYIGEHEITHEYLYDQPEIDHVIVYHLYSVVDA